MIVKEAQQVQAPQMELTAYLLCESWFADGNGGRKLWLYTDYEDAKAIFQSKITEENEDGILAKWENHPDRMESSKKDFFECWLDGQYAAFGKVTSGMEVVDAIAATRTGRNDRPVEEQKIASITVDTHGETYPAPTKLPDPYGRF